MCILLFYLILYFTLPPKKNGGVRTDLPQRPAVTTLDTQSLGALLASWIYFELTEQLIRRPFDIGNAHPPRKHSRSRREAAAESATQGGAHTAARQRNPGRCLLHICKCSSAVSFGGYCFLLPTVRRFWSRPVAPNVTLPSTGPRGAYPS